MDTPSTGEPAPSVTSVQVLEPHGAPEPPDRQRSWLVPGMALLLVMAFGGGYLLARNPGLSVLPDITDETTLVATSTAGPTTSSPRTDVTYLLNSEPSGWFPLAPPVLADGVELVAREEGQGVDDLAVDAAGYVWALGWAVATRWDPADGSYVTFGEEVFGYAVPDQVAAGPDGNVWITAGGDLFRFDGTWTRFRNADPDDHYPFELDVTPEGALLVVAAREEVDADLGYRLYRTGPGGDPTTAEALDLPMADVNGMAVGPGGEVVLAGGDSSAPRVFTLERYRLTRPVLPAANQPREMGDIAVTDRVWVTDPEGRSLYALENGEWVDVDLPDTGPAPGGGRYGWAIGADGEGVWAASTTLDGSGLQLLRIEEPDSYVSYPPFDGASGFVNAIEVAADGRVWLGTEAGLCSFDPGAGSWHLRTTPPVGGALPSSIDTVAVGPDGTLRVVLGTDPPGIGWFDGSTWVPTDGPIPTVCEEYGHCGMEMVGSPDGVVWILVTTWTGDALWRNVAGHTWEEVALPEGLSPAQDPVIGAGAAGTLWLTDPGLTAFFDGTGWTVFEVEGPYYPELMLVGADGTPWAVAIGWGISLTYFQDGLWRGFQAPLPDIPWGSAVAGGTGTIWMAAEGKVLGFDGTTWTLAFDAPDVVVDLAPTPGGGVWVAARNLWLLGDGPPVLVAQGLHARQLTADPDGSVWALAEGGLYHVESPD